METNPIRDKHGNYIGKDVVIKGTDGLSDITHYDAHNNRIGRSYEQRDYKGEVYMIHEDARGNRLAYTTWKKDWWGEYYVNTEQTIYGRQQAEDRLQKERDATDGESGRAVDTAYSVVILLLKVMAAIAGLIIYRILFMFKCGGTIWGIPLSIIIFNMGFDRTSFDIFIAYCITIILAVCNVAYLVYIGILFLRRIKKKITWGEVFRDILRWLFIGPFAYRKLVRQMKAEKYDPTSEPEHGKVDDLFRSLSKRLAHRKKQDETHVAGEDDLRVESNTCPNCGRATVPEDNFCKQCGTKLR